MHKPSRVKQVMIIAAILAALAVSGVAASYIIKMVMSKGGEAPAQAESGKHP